MTCTVIGIQPCISERWWRNGSGNVTATIVDVFPWELPVSELLTRFG